MDLIIQSLTKKYAKFTGRASRKEYWLFVLFYVIAGFSLGYLDEIFGTVHWGTNWPLLSGIFGIATFIPVSW